MVRAARNRSRITPIVASAPCSARAQPLPDYFVNAQTLAPADHLAVQAAAQKYIDSSISKTINCPADISFAAFKDIYTHAYEAGCKGCTHLPPQCRDGCRTGNDPSRASNCRTLRHPCPRHGRASDSQAGGVVYMTKPLRPPGRAHGPYLQDQMARSRPCLLHHHQRHRAGRPPPPIRDLHQLEEHGALRLDGGAHPHDQRGVPARRRRQLRRRGAESRVRPARRPVVGGRYVPSLLAAIGEVIERHLIDIGFMTGGGRGIRRPTRRHGRGGGRRRRRAPLPTLRRAGAVEARRLRHLRLLRLFEMRVSPRIS